MRKQRTRKTYSWTALISGVYATIYDAYGTYQTKT